MTTNKQINRAIKKATGYDVTMSSLNGICKFNSDDDETAYMVNLFESTGLCFIKDNTVAEWVETFSDLLADGGFPAIKS